MDAVELADILAWTGGSLVAGPERSVAAGVVTDSRAVSRGDCFVALVGERFDGHHFVGEAVGRGAAVVVYAPARFDPASLDRAGLANEASFVAVEDTKKAFQGIGRGYRLRFSIPVVGITGSNGKTTTKEMTKAVLAGLGEVVATEKNFNNEIGLPMTLLRIEGRHKAAVVEMGMRAAGEIAELASIALPTAGIVTNVGPVHVEFFGSVDEVAREKGALIRSLPEGGVAILNGDDPRVRAMAQETCARVVTYGIEGPADVRAEEIETRGLAGVEFTLAWPGGKRRVRLGLPGRHHVYNAAAAAAAGYALGVDVDFAARALESVRPASMRTEVVRLGSGIVLIDDAYNSSPLSSKAALEVLGDVEGKRKVAVLGDMRELGAYAGEAHRELGRRAARAGVEALIAVGEHARVVARAAKEENVGLDAVVCADAGEAAAAARCVVRPGDVVLVKGSRGVRLEIVTEALKSAFGVDGGEEAER